MVETLRPYNQSGPYSKYETTNHYRGLDLCIFPTYRRRAFLFARDGKLPFEKVVQEGANQEEAAEKKSLIGIVPDKTKHFDWESCMEEPVAAVRDAVMTEMPKGSQEHLDVKKRIDEELGITEGRGCYYNYLVKLVSNAVKEAYFTDRETA